MLKNQTSDLILQNTAAYITALAIQHTLPAAKWIGCGLYGDYFYCDFLVSSNFMSTLLIESIQQAIRLILDESDTYTVREMIGLNAQDYVKYRKGMISAIKNEGLLPVIELGNKTILASEQVLEDLDELVACKLLSITQPGIEPHYTRFIGCAVRNKMEMKSRQKAFNQIEKVFHATQNGFSDLAFQIPETGEWIWKPIGYTWLSFLSTYLTSSTLPINTVSRKEPLLSHILYATHALQAGCPLPISTSSSYKKNNPFIQNSLNKGWGLFSTKEETKINGLTLCNEKELEGEIISSLQFIEKTYKILGVEYRWAWRPAKPKNSLVHAAWNSGKQILSKALAASHIEPFSLPQNAHSNGPSAELIGFDSFGQPWPLASVTVDLTVTQKIALNTKPLSALACLQCSICESLEKAVAIILESYQHNFPLWLAPEQIRLIAATPAESAYCKQIAHYALAKYKLRTLVDDRLVPIKNKLASAELAGVPHIALIGGSEAQNHQLVPQSDKRSPAQSPLHVDEYFAKIQANCLAQMPMHSID